MSQTQVIDHPPYYQRCTDLTRPIVAVLIGEQYLDMECIEAIEKIGLLFAAGNALKYLWRAGDKGDLLTDLNKSRWYLQRCRNGRQITGLGKLEKAAKMLDELIEAQT